MAHALALDHLAMTNDAAGLAIAIETLGESLGSSGAKGRALLVAATVWGAHAADVRASRHALARALECGAPPQTVARVARMLAALRTDTEWYEQATHDLLRVADGRDKASLWLELGQSARLRGARTQADDAFWKLATCDASGGPASWMGRILGAYAFETSRESSDDEQAFGRQSNALPIERLAEVESEPQIARALQIVAAFRLAAAGDDAGAGKKLTELCAPHCVPTRCRRFFCRRSRAGAMTWTPLWRRCPPARGKPTTRIWRLRFTSRRQCYSGAATDHAMVHRFKNADPVQSPKLEASTRHAPQAAATVLSWALRGAAPDSTEGRRRALDVLAETSGNLPTVALERFALEMVAGDPAEGVLALEDVERDGTADLAMAGALARLIWPTTLLQRPSVESALSRLESAGSEAAAVA